MSSRIPAHLLRASALRLSFCLGLSVWAGVTLAEVVPLPGPGEDLVGAIRTVSATEEDTLIDIARRTDLGYDEIRAANPAVDAWLPHADTQVTIPDLHLLPNAPREGIVINAAELRLYYYPKLKAGQGASVETYPISIGRGDWSTPLVTTRISQKVTDPSWHPPKSIREEHAADGDPLPEVIRAGPDNPLGKYALHMGLPSYLIHGTNNQYGIGMQVTHGCIRMYADDIQRLFTVVPVGTTVRIINQPYKAGWHGGALYLEVHPPLEGVAPNQHQDKTPLIEALVEATKDRPDYPIDWQRARAADLEASGLPVQVGPALPIVSPASVPAANPAQAMAAPGPTPTTPVPSAEGAIDAGAPIAPMGGNDARAAAQP